MIFLRKRKFNILVLGSDGMLGHDVIEHFKCKSRLKDSNIGAVVGISRSDGIDFKTTSDLLEFLQQSLKFDFCINCIAMTDTRKAEESADGRISSFLLNALYTKVIAEVCAVKDIKLIHISTDWVFSEMTPVGMNKIPFISSDESVPTSIYGFHKLQGETYLMNAMTNAKCYDSYMVFRVSWLYGNYKKKSFVHKIILNAVKSLITGNGMLEVTSNEISIPTSTLYVCDRIEYAISNWKSEVKLGNIKHCVCAAPHRGLTRADFALAVLSNAALHTELLDGKQLSDVKIIPTERNSYWPKYSLMHSSWAYGDALSYLNEFLNSYGAEIVAWAKQSICN